MKKLFPFIVLALTIFFANAQPCKVVKPGMTKAEVLKLCGKPTKIDTLGRFTKDGANGTIEYWQYSNLTNGSYQAVEFNGDAVDGDVISDVGKYQEMLHEYTKEIITQEELQKRMAEVNRESCK